MLGAGLPILLGSHMLAVVEGWNNYFYLPSWELIRDPKHPQYHPWLAPVLIFHLMGALLVMGLTALALCLFFGKRRAFPKIFALLLWINLCFVFSLETAYHKISPAKTVRMKPRSPRNLIISVI